MVFKRMLSAFGIGGPSVDTVLVNPNTRPGLPLEGTVNLRGGEVDADIEQISVALVTRVEIEGDDVEAEANVEFHRMPVAGPMKLAAHQELAIPFQLPVPWETPITDLYGQRLRGMVMGLRTDVSIERAVDKGDLDPVSVHPLPVQERILDAFAQLGFQFKTADLEYGHIHGAHQTLPFYQEIEFFAAPQYAHSIKEIELTFLANPNNLDVILEADKRGSMFADGHDTFGRHAVDHADADRIDWRQTVDQWMKELMAGYGSVKGHGHHGGHGAVVGAVAGAALGFAGGLLAGEVLDEVFDDDAAEPGGDGIEFEFDED